MHALTNHITCLLTSSADIQVGLSLKRVRDSPGGALDEWFPITLSQGDRLQAASPSIRLQVLLHVLSSFPSGCLFFVLINVNVIFPSPSALLPTILYPCMI